MHPCLEANLWRLDIFCSVYIHVYNFAKPRNGEKRRMICLKGLPLWEAAFPNHCSFTPGEVALKY